MRELTRNGTPWCVHELDTSRVPGARADHCLIYESEDVVRRVWAYPPDWDALADDLLWALMESRSATYAPSPQETAESTLTRERAVEIPVTRELATIERAFDVTARTRSLLAELHVSRECSQSLIDEQRELRERCRTVHQAMQESVRAYAMLLRRDGVPPEQALVLIKQAMQGGITGPCLDEMAAEQVLRHGVEWCIDAYFAA